MPCVTTVGRCDACVCTVCGDAKFAREEEEEEKRRKKNRKKGGTICVLVKSARAHPDRFDLVTRLTRLNCAPTTTTKNDEITLKRFGIFLYNSLLYRMLIRLSASFQPHSDLKYI